jgi:hypothetical protein
LAVGGLGIWTAVYTENITNVSSSLYTYFLALTAASALDLVLAEKQLKYVRAVAMLIGMIIVSLAIRMIVHPDGVVSLACGIVGYVIAIVLWWVANADNPNLSDGPSSSTGGDPKRPTIGSAEGYTTV